MTAATVTQEGRAAARAGDSAAYLFFVLQCTDLAVPSLRIALDETDEVRLGRGDRLDVARRVEAGRRVVEVRLPNGWMSSHHAQVVRADGRFLAIDCRSRNGSRLDGAPLDRSLLDDGSTLDLAGSFLHLRYAPRTATAGDATLGPRPVTAAAPAGLATLHPLLEAELERLRIVAPTGLPVEVAGETGTGKELIARALHALSGREGELVAVNCGALPRELLESELFGHERGAFSGAVGERLGHVRAAHRGTLFLDEIGDLPPPSQASLLRVLQEGEVMPLGARRAQRVDVRIVSATHADVGALVDAGRFRADLQARLVGFRLQLPPLRERRCDLGALIRGLSSRRAPALPPPRFSRDAAQQLLLHLYPQNLRELERALALAMTLAGEAPIEVAHLPETMRSERSRPTSPALPLDDGEDRRVAELRRLLTEHAGNVAAVARAVGRAPAQVHRSLKRYAIDPTPFRRPQR